MKTWLPRLLVLTALVLGAGLQAQTVYRCGDSYSQTPCPGGSTVDATDRRTPEQRKAHEAAVKRDKRTGDALERARLKEEADVQRATQKAEQAQREADKAGAKATARKKSAHPEKLPAYRAPAPN